MNHRRVSSIVVLLMCMSAIIIFGQHTLLRGEGTENHTVVQGMQQEESISGFTKDKWNIAASLNQEDTLTEGLSLIPGDIYQELTLKGMERKQNREQQAESEYGETEENYVSGLSIDELEEIKEQERLNEQKEREDNAIEAIANATTQMSVSATQAILMDSSTKEVLFSKDALTTIQPASTAKLLTAIVAIELSDEGEEFVVGSEIELMAIDSSRAYLAKGQVLSLSNILDALLLPSGNDAAYVIAANLGRKIAKDDTLKPKAAVKVFLEKMNEMAYEIGVVNSNFCSPDGYDAEGQYTTAYDLALIASKALEYEEILDSVKKPKARNILISGEDVTWYNSNRLVKQGSGYYYQYAIGLKTGTSGEAGRCLIAAAQNKDESFVSVVMNASYEGRWQDSINLLDYAIRN